MLLLFIIPWFLGWIALLQSTWYGYLKTFAQDEEVQGNAAHCQTVWAVAGILTLAFAGLMLFVNLA